MNRRDWFPLLDKPRRLAVGLMSGTSADGIDAAAVAVTGQGNAIGVKLLAFSNTPFPEEIRDKIFAAFRMGESGKEDKPGIAPPDGDVTRLLGGSAKEEYGSGSALSRAFGLRDLGSLHMELGELYAQAALDVIRTAGLKPEDVDVAGSHGQTVWHQPAAEEGGRAFTVQLGDGNVIAQRTGIPCVSDFRAADMAAGGQGAPLVPFTEYLLYREERETVLLQNIGGVGNITVLPAGGTPEDVIAFDTGPGNMIIDALAAQMTGGRLKMDQGGKIAAGGRVRRELLTELLAHPYFAEKPPKTTGREMFGAQYAEELRRRSEQRGIEPADLMATVTAFTAESIVDACRRFICPFYRPGRLLVGGGGSYNPVLMGMLAEAAAPLGIRTLTQEEIGGSSDAKEAIAFALLADCTLRGVPGALPGVTGAAYGAILGKVSYPCGKRRDGRA